MAARRNLLETDQWTIQQHIVIADSMSHKMSYRKILQSCKGVTLVARVFQFLCNVSGSTAAEVRAHFQSGTNILVSEFAPSRRTKYG